MSRKRTPEAVIGDEDYLIVKFTHDEALARELMAAALREQDDGYTSTTIARRLKCPQLRWVRCLGALPNSYAALEGWSYAYHEQQEKSRGAFPAVIFYG
jgi:hypothetical protein